MHEAALRLHGAETLEELLDAVRQEFSNLLGARHVFVYLYDPEWNDLHGRKADDRDEIRFPLGQGLAGLAALEKRVVRSRNAPAEASYIAEIDSADEGGAREALAAPLFGPSGELLGVAEAVGRDGTPFSAENEYAATLLADHAGGALARAGKENTSRRFLLEVLGALAGAIDAKNISTIDHSYRVVHYCRRLAQAMGIGPRDASALEVAALLHDVGRLAVEATEQPDGTFETLALERLKPHVLYTEALLRNVRFPEALIHVPEIVLCHHEFLDGSGYPRGKTAESIPLLARMLIVADSFDAFLHGRRTPGRTPEEEEALVYLKKGAGRLFDPNVVRTFVERQCYAVEQRRFPRVEYETPVDVVIVGPDGTEEKSFSTDAIDLSEGGILFLAPEPIAPHTLLKLVIRLPSENMEAIAKVARVLSDEGRGRRIGAYFLWYGSVS